MTSKYISVYRIDRKNVGDWWSVPARFFDLCATREVDLVADGPIADFPGVVIVGGGGLGRPGFEPHLRQLARQERNYALVAWGVGADSLTVRGSLLTGPRDMDKLLSYFDGFDLVGTRIDSSCWNGDRRVRWVPCASCMSPLFDPLRDRPPTERIGVYEHLRESVLPHLDAGGLLGRLFPPYPLLSNRGINFAEKLSWLARFEVIVTNSYHGVYWGTLLGRKVVCLPFKNGLFTFRHPPAYLGEDGLDVAIERARVYPSALAECRAANQEFYRKVIEEYGVP